MHYMKYGLTFDFDLSTLTWILLPTEIMVCTGCLIKSEFREVDLVLQKHYIRNVSGIDQYLVWIQCESPFDVVIVEKAVFSTMIFTNARQQHQNICHVFRHSSKTKHQNIRLNFCGSFF